MPTTQPEKGSRGTYRARYGLDIGRCRGIDDSHDPSMLPDENLVEGINMRVHDGIGVSRGGQQKVLGVGAALVGCIYGAIEVSGAGGGSGSGGGSFYLRVEVTIDSEDHLYTYVPPATMESCTLPSGQGGVNMLYKSNSGGPKPKLFQKFNGGTIVPIRDSSPNQSDLVIVELIDPGAPDAGNKIKTKELLRIRSGGSVYSMATLPPAGPSGPSETLFFSRGTTVSAWNPTEGLVDLANDFPPNSGVLVFAAHGTIWAAGFLDVGLGSNDIRRLNGWTQGKSLSQATWTTVTGLPTTTRLFCAAEFRGVTYTGGKVIGGDQSIYQIDNPLGASPSLSAAHVVTPGGAGGSLWIADMVVAKSGLVYAWQGRDPDDGADTGDAVGLFDGTTWSDTAYFIDMAEVQAPIQIGYRLYTDSGGDAFYYLRRGGDAFDRDLSVIRRYSIPGGWSVYATADHVTRTFQDIILR